VKDAKDVALAFMEAFWRGEPARAETFLTPEATWVFQRSMPQALEAGAVWPLARAMRRIVDDLFGAFDPERGFDVEVTSAIAEGDEVAIEYRATGWTRWGREYRSTYAARLTVRDGKVCQLRPYNDTKYMLDELIEP
jgi:ketosteroid isomerase-like protein